MRTQKDEKATEHLSNSLKIFQILLEISRSLNDEKIATFVEERDYEALDLYIMKQLLGRTRTTT
jgi:xylose isomerase